MPRKYRYDPAHRGRPYVRTRAAVLAASGICWLCGHEGADVADHVIEARVGGSSMMDNLKPAHGINKCPTCGRDCNGERAHGGTFTPDAPPSREW